MQHDELIHLAESLLDTSRHPGPTYRRDMIRRIDAALGNPLLAEEAGAKLRDLKGRLENSLSEVHLGPFGGSTVAQ